jgi:membrane protease YdiL (CAAX protease family)
VTSLYIPWDFVLILLLLAVVIPWRGTVRMKRLMSLPETTATERLSLYGSTILFQWLLVLVVAWRCVARSVDLEELGLSASDPWRIAWISAALTVLLCLNQVVGLSKMSNLPPEKRGSVFAVSQRIMPRTSRELLVFAALACTAGISEEFLYRGFAFLAFVRMIVNYGPPNATAAVLSSLWFAVAHAYQGRRGVITTFVVGIIFASIRIWTGSILPAMAAHFGIDLVAGLCFSRLLRSA